METAKYALKDCRICQGKGRVRVGDSITDWAVCPCALAGLRKEAADKLIHAALPPRALEMTLSSYDTGGIAQNERALGAAYSWVENYEQAAEKGWVLGFTGAPRSGKTHLATAIAQACAKRYMARPMLLNLPKALREERERFRNPDRPSPFADAALVDLLVLDDLGAEYERMADDPSRVSWLSEQLYVLIDERVMNNRPFLYTTNLSRSDMDSRYSNEAWTRVLARIREAEVNPAGPLEVQRVSGEGSVGGNKYAADILLGGDKS